MKRHNQLPKQTYLQWRKTDQWKNTEWGEGQLRRERKSEKEYKEILGDRYVILIVMMALWVFISVKTHHILCLQKN